MLSKWMTATPEQFAMAAISFVVVYAAIIGLTRIAGLRSFSKMSAPDFAMTVAVGSLFGSSISTSSPPLALALFAFACLFGGQWLVAFVRRKSERASQIVDNAPLLLMDGREILDHNLRRANVTRSDLRAKLREANVLRYEHVRAVVFETTGDISVLHTSSDDETLETELLQGVRR